MKEDNYHYHVHILVETHPMYTPTKFEDNLANGFTAVENIIKELW